MPAALKKLILKVSSRLRGLLPRKRPPLPELQGIKSVVHVGARVGEEIKDYVDVYGADRILLFEPNPIHVAELLENIGKYKSKALIEFSNYALGSRPGNASLTSYQGFSSGLSSLKPINHRRLQSVFGKDIRHEYGLGADTYQFNVAVETLDNYLSENKLEAIDLLCIDTQGFELEVLKGAEGALKVTKMVICEVTMNPEHSPYGDIPAGSEIVDFLQSHGFALQKDYGLWGEFKHGNMLFVRVNSQLQNHGRFE